MLFMEWRPEYEILISRSDNKLDAKITAPAFSFHQWGIYNHFVTEVVDDTVRIMPRFLFGIPFNTVVSMYNGGNEFLSKLPIIGVFNQSTRLDRVIIQAYMNLVTLSVIFLLWANNPPELLMKNPAPDAAASSITSEDSSDVAAAVQPNGKKVN